MKEKISFYLSKSGLNKPVSLKVLDLLKQSSSLYWINFYKADKMSVNRQEYLDIIAKNLNLHTEYEDLINQEYRNIIQQKNRKITLNYQILEYLESRNLEEILNTDKLSLAQLLEIVLQIIKGVKSIQELGFEVSRLSLYDILKKEEEIIIKLHDFIGKLKKSNKSKDRITGSLTNIILKIFTIRMGSQIEKANASDILGIFKELEEKTANLLVDFINRVRQNKYKSIVEFIQEIVEIQKSMRKTYSYKENFDRRTTTLPLSIPSQGLTSASHCGGRSYITLAASPVSNYGSLQQIEMIMMLGIIWQMILWLSLFTLSPPKWHISPAPLVLTSLLAFSYLFLTIQYFSYLLTVDDNLWLLRIDIKEMNLFSVVDRILFVAATGIILAKGQFYYNCLSAMKIDRNGLIHLIHFGIVGGSLEEMNEARNQYSSNKSDSPFIRDEEDLVKLARSVFLHPRSKKAQGFLRYIYNLSSDRERQKVLIFRLLEVMGKIWSDDVSLHSKVMRDTKRGFGLINELLKNIENTATSAIISLLAAHGSSPAVYNGCTRYENAASPVKSKKEPCSSKVNIFNNVKEMIRAIEKYLSRTFQGQYIMELVGEIKVVEGKDTHFAKYDPENDQIVVRVSYSDDELIEYANRGRSRLLSNLKECKKYIKKMLIQIVYSEMVKQICMRRVKENENYLEEWQEYLGEIYQEWRTALYSLELSTLPRDIQLIGKWKNRDSSCTEIKILNFIKEVIKELDRQEIPDEEWVRRFTEIIRKAKSEQDVLGVSEKPLKTISEISAQSEEQRYDTQLIAKIIRMIIGVIFIRRPEPTYYRHIVNQIIVSQEKGIEIILDEDESPLYIHRWKISIIEKNKGYRIKIRKMTFFQYEMGNLIEDILIKDKFLSKKEDLQPEVIKEMINILIDALYLSNRFTLFNEDEKYKEFKKIYTNEQNNKTIITPAMKEFLKNRYPNQDVNIFNQIDIAFQYMQELLKRCLGISEYISNSTEVGIYDIKALEAVHFLLFKESLFSDKNRLNGFMDRMRVSLEELKGEFLRGSEVKIFPLFR